MSSSTAATSWSKRPTSHADRRPATRGRVLDVVRSSGPVSRVEIADATGLAQASVTVVVKDLLEQGFVREVGQGASTGGRPRIMLELNPDGAFAIGAHVGWDRSTLVLTDLTGRVVASTAGRGAHRREPHDVVTDLAENVEQLRREVIGAPVLGLGVVAPGPIDRRRGTAVQLPSSAPWHEFSLTDALADATGLQVLIDNDATAAAAGEYWAGTAETGGSFAVVYMDLGIGAGIMVKGQPYYGTSGNAGEIGHISVNMAGARCHCGNRGCVELVAAPHATQARYEQATGSAIDYAQIIAAAREGEVAAVDAIRASAEALSIALLSVANVLDLDLIILAGPGFVGAPLYVEVLQRYVDDALFARRTHRLTVRLSNHAHDAAALGGAALILHDLVTV